MADARGAILRFTIKITGGQNLVTLMTLQGDKLEVRDRLNRTNLADLRNGLNEDLECFKRHIGYTLDVDNWEDVSKAVHRLYMGGLRLMYELFGEECQTAAKLCQRAYLLWRMDTDTPPLVEVVMTSINDIAPVEFLPLFHLEPPNLIPEMDDIQSLLTFLRRFLGFSTQIRRVIPRVGFTGKAILENVPQLPVKFFQHARFKGARDEAAFFLRLKDKGWMDLEGPWPDRNYPPNQVVQTVAEHLRNPAQRFNGPDRHPPDQVQHFGCHYDPSDPISNNHYLQLAHQGGGSRDVTIGDLKAWFVPLPRKEQQSVFPLIFFNACSGSKINPTCVASFLSLVLENKNCGFIGSEANIPDSFAAAFSKQFYIKLLQGQSLGNAIYLAKRTLLTRHNNPLGILYTAYADPDTHVQNPIPRGDLLL